MNIHTMNVNVRASTSLLEQINIRTPIHRNLPSKARKCFYGLFSRCIFQYVETSKNSAEERSFEEEPRSFPQLSRLSPVGHVGFTKYHMKYI